MHKFSHMCNAVCVYVTCTVVPVHIICEGLLYQLQIYSMTKHKTSNFFEIQDFYTKTATTENIDCMFLSCHVRVSE